MKFWIASMKTLANYENPSSNPLQTACCGLQEPVYKLFRKPEMTLSRVTVLLFKTGIFKRWIEAPNSLWVAASQKNFKR